MPGEKDLTKILATIEPKLQDGDYVFCSVADRSKVAATDVVMYFAEEEGVTLILKKEKADELGLSYGFVAAWITLTVHSSLEAVGLTSAFSRALADAGISCNVVAAYYHDHIFVPKADAQRAMETIRGLRGTLIARCGEGADAGAGPTDAQPAEARAFRLGGIHPRGCRVTTALSRTVRPIFVKRNVMTNEQQIRALIEDWAAAVRRQDIDAILAHHSEDIVMFDVPPPFQSVGIDAYKKTWDIFFANTKPDVFDIQTLNIFADEQIAYCIATMQCADCSGGKGYEPLDFRLTVGLRKIKDQWTIVHEHHSIPAE